MSHRLETMDTHGRTMHHPPHFLSKPQADGGKGGLLTLKEDRPSGDQEFSYHTTHTSCTRHFLSSDSQFKLQAYGGKGGLLSLKEDKHSGDQVITAVDRTCELFTTFRYVVA